jgi:hypothetical protein
MKPSSAFQILVLAATLLAGATRSGAQGLAHLVSTPALGDALPFVEAPDGVHLKFPVLLNEREVVEPADILRLVYVDPNAGVHARGRGRNGGSGDEPQAHHIHAPATGMGAPADNKFPDYDPDAPPSAKKVSSEMGAEVWKEAQLFREALNQAADIGTMLVYAEPGKARPGSAEVDLPDGMLLGGPDGRIVVLALTADSEAGQAGLQPLDEIRAINGQPVPGNLRAFGHFYRGALDQAHGQSYSLEVWRPAESRTVTLQVGAPPSIPKMF